MTTKAEPVTGRQVEILRSLPCPHSELAKDPDALRLFRDGFITREGMDGGKVIRLFAADILLATLDKLNEQAIHLSLGRVTNTIDYGPEDTPIYAFLVDTGDRKQTVHKLTDALALAEGAG